MQRVIAFGLELGSGFFPWALPLSSCVVSGKLLPLSQLETAWVGARRVGGGEKTTAGTLEPTPQPIQYSQHFKIFVLCIEKLEGVI